MATSSTHQYHVWSTTPTCSWWGNPENHQHRDSSLVSCMLEKAYFSNSSWIWVRSWFQNGYSTSAPTRTQSELNCIPPCGNKQRLEDLSTMLDVLCVFPLHSSGDHVTCTTASRMLMPYWDGTKITDYKLFLASYLSFISSNYSTPKFYFLSLLYFTFFHLL